MRKLASGQSVMLYAPPEIDRKIAEYCGLANSSSVQVEDVLFWCIGNTHDCTRKSVGNWATQGMRHQKRQIVWHGNEQPNDVLEPEAKSLQEWYGVRERDGNTEWLQSYGDDVLIGRSSEVAAIRGKMADFGADSVHHAALHEEQERELSPEAEQERQLERPLKVDPVKHEVHEDLVQMVKQGCLQSDSPAILPAFRTLKNTSATDGYDLSTWPTGLLATEDFARTIQAGGIAKQNDFIRPVHWVLSHRASNLLIVISPFEANELQPLICKQDKIALHPYSPRVKQSMRRLDDLEYCSIPSRGPLDPLPELNMQIQLNLFAGQLYFRDREEYVAVSRFLGLATRVPNDGIEITRDGFVAPKDRKQYDTETARVCTMDESPVHMLRTLVALRRKGQMFDKTHVGLLLGGELIKDNAFSA